MSKFALKVDTLKVESFETATARGGERGTVFANGTGGYAGTCGNTCNGANTCNCPETAVETCGLYCGGPTVDTCDICA